MNSSSSETLPPGKLDPVFLQKVLGLLSTDRSVLLGPGVARDAAVIQLGRVRLAMTSDPVTLSSSHIARHLAHINANDVACTGAAPKWLLVTLLLPPATNKIYIETFFRELSTACGELKVQLVGGHTEVTEAVNQPTAIGCMVGILDNPRVMNPQDIKPGDAILLTRGLAVEGTYVLYQAHKSELVSQLDRMLLHCLNDYLRVPGITIVPEANLAAANKNTRYLHDLTEGGLVAGLWDISTAAGVGTRVYYPDIPIFKETRMLCEKYGIDPLRLLASGALLIVVDNEHASDLNQQLAEAGILCRSIGEVTDRADEVELVQEDHSTLLPRMNQDELLRVLPPGESK